MSRPDWIPGRGIVRQLLVTNDFPPKHGGIQSYLYELWRRFDPDDVLVYTTPHLGAAEFDAAQPFRIDRSAEPILVPHPGLIRRVDELAGRFGAEVVILDPVLPLGRIGPALDVPYAVVVHGAEVTVPGAAPLVRRSMAKVLRGAALVIAGGTFPAAEAERIAEGPLPTCVIPPGVDNDRFTVSSTRRRAEIRARYGVGEDARLVVSLSRLVPRKGMDVLIEASARLAAEFGDLEVLIGGTGRDEARLRRLIADSGAPARLVGRVETTSWRTSTA